MTLILKFFLFFNITLYASFAQAQTYLCVLNTAAKKKSMTASEVGQFIKKFSYDAKKEVGKSIKLDPYKLIVWKKEKFLNVKLVGGPFKKPLSIQFSAEQKVSRFNYGGDLDLECVNGARNATAAALELTSQKNLEPFGEKILVAVKKPIVFRYLQTEESQKMRTVFFQDGNLFTASSRLEKKLPWCLLRIQLKRDEDTTIPKGDEFNPVSFQKQENSTYFTTYSYSFVDFGAGKKKGEKLHYNPFMMDCNILRGMPFKAQVFSDIVGDYLGLKANL